MFKFITSKPLWVNFVAAFGLIILLVILFFLSLSWITGFGKLEKVPSVVGQNATAAKKILEDKGFHVALQDSVYVDSVAKLAIVRQSPEPDAIVKSGRTIYLTINRSLAPMVEMPNLVGFSIRSAEMYLQSLGLKLGVISYKPDIARNAVLEQTLNDIDVIPNTKIPLGSAISLVLGSGVGGGDIDVPDLIGLTYQEAKSWITSLSLNIGSVIPVGTIADTNAAFIVKQSPEVYIETVPGQKTANKIHSGQLLDIYISSVAPIKDSVQATINQ